MTFIAMSCFGTPPSNRRSCNYISTFPQFTDVGQLVHFIDLARNKSTPTFVAMPWNPVEGHDERLLVSIVVAWTSHLGAGSHWG